MTNSTIDVPTPDGVADAYLTRPDDEPHPGVLLMIDAIGLRGTIEAMADRIARRGCVVLAPNVFYRGGRAPIPPTPDFADPDSRAKLWETIRPLMAQLTPEAIVSDGRAYLDALEQHAQPPFAITGYCMGARLGWRIAAADPERVIALAGFHGGGLVTDAPDSPHLSAPSLRAEVYMGHADEDANMTPEQIAELERALSDAGVAHRTEVYAGAKHGYTMADSPVFDEAARERHFRELFALLERAMPAPIAQR
jgi:carboxymethylenebutenolidase